MKTVVSQNRNGTKVVEHHNFVLKTRLKYFRLTYGQTVLLGPEEQVPPELPT